MHTDYVAISVSQVVLSRTVPKCVETWSHANGSCLCLFVMQRPNER